MTPGPTIIRKCSACGSQIAQHTLGSGNTFGAKFWTDGKREAPMLPDLPLLVRCPHCAATVWIEEQKKVGEVDFMEDGPGVAKFKDAQPYSDPTVEDYLAALGQGLTDIQKVRYLRMHTWWAWNDKRREGSDASPLCAHETENLQAFAALLSESDDEDRIMKAEIMREMGKYKEALALLAGQFSGGMAQAVQQIKDLASREDPLVRELLFE